MEVEVTVICLRVQRFRLIRGVWGHDQWWCLAREFIVKDMALLSITNQAKITEIVLKQTRLWWFPGRGKAVGLRVGGECWLG